MFSTIVRRTRDTRSPTLLTRLKHITKDLEQLSQEASNLATDRKNSTKFIKNLREPSNDNSGNISPRVEHRDVVEYNGVLMSAKTRTVLKHIDDSIHPDSSTTPNMTFRVGEFKNIGDSDKYKAKDDGPGNKFNAQVYSTYMINDEKVESDYFCIDDIYFEMFQNQDDYGVSWMKIYFSENGVAEFIEKFKEDTEWELKDTLFYPDYQQNLFSLCVSLDEHNPPSWKEWAEHSKGFHDRGGFDTVLGNPELHGVYRGTGIFSSTFNVVPEHDDRPPTRPTTDALSLCEEGFFQDPVPLGRVRMQLIGVRIFEKMKNLRKIGSKGIRGF